MTMTTAADSGGVRIVDADKVHVGREQMLDADEVTNLTELFKLLGDPTRVRLLYTLAEVGEMCVSDLATVVDVPETSVSHALRLLRTAGIVRNRKSGRLVYYCLDDAHVRQLLDVSAEHLRH